MASVSSRPKALFILGAPFLDIVYGPEERADLEKLVEFVAPPQTADSVRDNLQLVSDVEFIFSTWGAPKLDEVFLAAAPKLRAFFYGAGSIRGFTTEAAWNRGIVISSAYAANSLPVAEYTLGAILLSLKGFWRLAGSSAGQGWDPLRPVAGSYKSTVGLVSCGAIARRVLKLLEPFEVRRITFDPFLPDAQAEQIRVDKCALDDLFQSADVVSLHTPQLSETIGMITGSHFLQMKPYATFINTARGAVVRESEMIAALRERTDLTAVLDVTDPEPPAPTSPLLELPNVVRTPHIAGSMGNECRRMGRYMVEECQRYLSGEPLKWGITKEAAEKMA